MPTPFPKSEILINVIWYFPFSRLGFTSIRMSFSSRSTRYSGCYLSRTTSRTARPFPSSSLWLRLTFNISYTFYIHHYYYVYPWHVGSAAAFINCCCRCYFCVGFLTTNIHIRLPQGAGILPARVVVDYGAKSKLTPITSQPPSPYDKRITRPVCLSASLFGFSVAWRGRHVDGLTREYFVCFLFLRLPACLSACLKRSIWNRAGKKHFCGGWALQQHAQHWQRGLIRGSRK